MALASFPKISFESDSSEEDEELIPIVTQQELDDNDEQITKMDIVDREEEKKVADFTVETDINGTTDHENSLVHLDSTKLFSTKTSDNVLLSLVKKAVDFEDDEDEEEDEPIPIFIPPPEPEIDNGSAEFIEAQLAIKNDPWNVNGWLIFVEEVEMGRGGGMSIADAYQSFLAQFPRSGRYWRLLADYYIQREEYNLAEDVFRKCLLKCRSIGLWQSYLEMIRKKNN